MSKSDIKYVKKLSAKTIGFTMEVIRDLVKKGATDLFNVFGVSIGVRYGNGDNGPWTKFVGQFEAVNTKTSKIVRSGELFLPASVTPILEAQILSGKGNEAFKGVQFSLEVGAKKSDLPIGYEFSCNDLMPPNENDLLANMRKEYVNPKLLA